MAQSHNQIGPLSSTKPKQNVLFWKITLKDCLSLLIGATIPVVIGIYTAVSNDQAQQSARLAVDEQNRIASERREFDFKQATELYQQNLYKNFLDDIYTLHKDGELNESANPWAFANARYRAGHRIWDAVRKGQVLQFLKEKQLIGRQKCTTACEIENVEDIIRLNRLNFDNVNLSSETGNLYQLDLSCIKFDEVSMTNAIFSSVNLNGITFERSRLNGAQFSQVLLACAMFNGTDLHRTDFGDSNLDGASFINVNLSTAKLTSNQKERANFDHVIMPNETKYTSKIVTASSTTRSTDYILLMLLIHMIILYFVETPSTNAVSSSSVGSNL